MTTNRLDIRPFTLNNTDEKKEPTDINTIQYKKKRSKIIREF